MEKTYNFLKLLIWVLLFAVLMAGAWVLYNTLSGQVETEGLAVAQTTESARETTALDTTQDTAPDTTPAPDFTVYAQDGTAYNLSDFQGKPVILNFWASWCGPCKSEMPDIEQAFLTYGDRIHFLIVNLTDGYQETLDSASSYISDNGYTFPVYFDTAMEAAYAYNTSSIPVTYFIDSDGNLQAYFRGAMSSDILQQGVDLLLEEVICQTECNTF